MTLQNIEDTKEFAVPKKVHKLPEKDRIDYVNQVIDTFPEANQFSIGMSKDALIWCATKLRLQQLGLVKRSRQSNIGEFRIYHTAMGMLILSQIDPIEGINSQTLRTTAINQFHTATQNYYANTNQDYVKKYL